jgi:hypothetical protein
LIQPIPELKVTSSAGTVGAIEWDGPKSEPPLLNARLVIKGKDSVFPLAELLASVRWSCSDGLQLVSSDSSGAGTDRAIYQVLRAGNHKITASISILNTPLTAAITARPAEINAGPMLLETRFEYTDPVQISHSNTKGAWNEAVVRVRTDGVNWKPLASDNILEGTLTAETDAEYEVWYRPWGVAATTEPWRPGTGWVVSKPMRAQLLEPRNWPIFWLTMLLGCGSIIALFMLANGHRNRWSVIEWNTSPHGLEGCKVRGYCGPLPIFRRAKYRFLRRVVEIEIPHVPNMDEYAWTILARGGNGTSCRAFIEWHNDGHHFVVNGQREDGALKRGGQRSVGATGAGNYQLCVSHPASIQDRQDRGWLPLYLRIHEHKHTTVRNFVQHWMLIFVSGSLMIAGAITYLALVRVI